MCEITKLIDQTVIFESQIKIDNDYLREALYTQVRVGRNSSVGSIVEWGRLERQRERERERENERERMRERENERERNQERAGER